MRPTVSVAIFTHDHERYVAECIESFLSQSLPIEEIEIIVVDDASTDRTWDIVERYRSEPKVRHLIRHAENTKAPRSYRDGMAAATGRYLVPVDGDDLALSRDALGVCVDLLERHPAAGFVHSAFDLIDSQGRSLGTQRVDRTSNVMPSGRAFRRLLLNNHVHHSGTMIRREQFDEAGGYNVSMMYSVDWDLWLRIAARHDVAYVAEPLYAYRIHPGNLHLTRAAVLETQVLELIDVVDRAIVYGPADARGMRGRSHAAAYLLLASWRFAHFEAPEGFSALARAFAADRLLLRHRELYRALIRLLASTLLGRGGYRALRGLRDRIRLRRGGQRGSREVTASR